MDDAVAVQDRQRIQHRDARAECVARWQWPARQAVGQRFALDQLHGDERAAVDVAQIVDLADERVHDPRRDPRLADQPRAGARIGGGVAQQLERDATLETLVERLVDDAHPTLAQPADDPVVRHALTGLDGRRGLAGGRDGRGRSDGAGGVVEGGGLEERRRCPARAPAAIAPRPRAPNHRHTPGRGTRRVRPRRARAPRGTPLPRGASARTPSPQSLAAVAARSLIRFRRVSQPSPSPAVPSSSFLKLAGPGLVVAATGIGSGDVVSATVGGARYGVVLLWAIALGAFFKFVLSEGIARWQLATGPDGDRGLGRAPAAPG